MSSDTAKENASVVDSSVTEWKQDMGNSDDPESSSYKVNEDGYPSREDKVRNSHDPLGKSTTSKKGKLYNTRYFIIKSLNHDNIQRSIEKGIWATQVMNEPILEEAFLNSGKVILIFSVNMSGFFQGYAQMMSSVGWRRDNVWNQGSGKSNPWGRSFKVKWLQLNDLPFQKTLHLRNPLNDYKPVKISRDCQELSPDIGEALCELLDGKSDVDDSLSSFYRDDIPSKRPCVDSPCSLGNEEYNVPPVHMPWSRTPMLYPSLLYPHQPEANRFHLGYQSSTGVMFPNNPPITTGSSQVDGTKCSRINGDLSNLQVDVDMSSRYEVWGLSAESPFTSTLTDDDFLEMSYEEYLEAHSRSNKQLCLPVAGPSRKTQESSRSKKHDEDLNSSCIADRCSSRKRTHHSS
ncbi:YTH domain-containing protein 1 isoform X1 [Quercus lobata]|uniref:YTH domain-containing family protein n=1 Tax=Quercus lobata TaxID=97700 RepID=A0A7N2REH8_QUELO|nr:YTH domain-containing protein 1 isoform X1 [Quercus lobata]XP_030947347.1 YTH domain-containing protein 1 isoform X1 [Quercus lobata]